MPRYDLIKGTTYLDKVKEAAQKDKTYEVYLKEFRQNGKYGVKVLNNTIINKNNKGEVNLRTKMKSAFLK